MPCTDGKSITLFYMTIGGMTGVLLSQTVLRNVSMFTGLSFGTLAGYVFSGAMIPRTQPAAKRNIKNY